MRKILIDAALFGILFVPVFSPKNSQNISDITKLKSYSTLEEKTDYSLTSLSTSAKEEISYKTTMLSNKVNNSDYIIKNGKLIRYNEKAGNNKKIVIPKGVTSIGDKAFEIERLRGYIYIPASVREIGEDAFSFGSVDDKCGIIVDKGNKYFKSVDGWLYSKDGKRLIYAYAGSGNLVIPEGVEYLGAGSLNTDLNGDGGKQEIYLPSTIKKMHNASVYWNDVHFSGDAPVVVGKTNLSLQQNCSLLVHRIYVPEGKKQDFIRALKVKTGYEDDVIEEGTGITEYNNEIINNDYVVCNGTLLDYTGAGGRIDVPEGITRIGQKVFWDINVDITSIHLPSSIKSIAALAFSYMDTLESINLPKGITSIGAEAFSDCRNLKSLDLPSSVTKIGEAAFSTCKSLKSFKLPSHIKVIEPMTFAGCSKLEVVSIPNGVTTIGESAFEGCNKLKSIMIPKSVTSINSKAFSLCSNLKIIYGYRGSAAEKFAKAHGYKFRVKK